MKKLTFIISLALLQCVSASARTISPAEAWARVQENPMAASRGLRAPGVMPAPVYTAPAAAYYVFDAGGDGGYVIASGDDMAAPVLADVPAGSFDRDAMPPAMRWWLDEYAAQIAWLREQTDYSEPGEVADNLSAQYAVWEPVGPVMTTEWTQDDPYNRECPTMYGQRCMTGCVATAMAQVIHAIGYADGRGYKAQGSVSFNYSDYEFDFGSMPDRLSDASDPAQIDAVAKLMLACGLSVGMSYGVDASGAFDVDIPYALINNFGYDAAYTRIYDRGNFSTARWESMLYAELMAGRPVCYGGNGTKVGHSFVVDGYAPHGLWHVNWGWGGVSDGYFRLSALQPSASDASTHYTFLQSMVKAVPPGADPGVVPASAAGSLSMVSDGVYAVYFHSLGVSNQDVSLGALIVDDAGRPVQQVIFWSNQSMTSGTELYKREYYHDFMQYDLAPGRYRIYPAMSGAGSDRLEIVEPYANRQYYVSMSVDADGHYSFSNLTDSGLVQTYDIHIAEVADGALLSGYYSALSCSVVNNGLYDFTGSITVGLADEASGAVLCSGEVKWAYIPAGSNVELSTSVFLSADGADVPPGRYRLLLADSDGREITSDVCMVTVTDGTPPNTWQRPEHLAVLNGSGIPQTLSSGSLWAHMPEVSCDREVREAQLYVRFYEPGGNVAVNTYQVFDGRIPVCSGSFDIEMPLIDADFGIYDVAYTLGNAEISERRRVKVGVNVDGIYYQPCDDGGAEVAPHPDKAYSGSLHLPEGITAIGRDAFSGCRGLEALHLPGSVTSVQRNALAYCANLRYLFIDSDVMPFAYRNYVAPGLRADAEFYVAPHLYECCVEAVAGRNPVYVKLESIGGADVDMTSAEAEAELPLLPAHDGVRGDFTVEPDGADPLPVEAEVIGVEGGRLRVRLTANAVGTADFVVRSAQPGVEPARIHVTVSDAASGISAPDAVQSPARYYDLSGRKVSGRASSGSVIIRVKDGRGEKTVNIND